MRIRQKTLYLLTVTALVGQGSLTAPPSVAGLLYPSTSHVQITQRDGSEVPSAIEFGTDLDLRACVRGDVGTPRGEVTLFTDQQRRGSAVLPLDGCVDFFLTEDLDIGQHTLRATYVDTTESVTSSGYLSSNCTVPVTVERAGLLLDLNRVAVNSRPVDPDEAEQPVRVGSSLTYKAELCTWCVFEAGPPRVPTGTMTFRWDGKILETVPLLEGSATVTVPSPRTGLHHLSAEYSGDRWFTVDEQLVASQSHYPVSDSVIVHDSARSLLLYPQDGQVTSGEELVLRTYKVASLEGTNSTRLVDTRTGTVIAASDCIDTCEWTLSRAKAQYDLQAQSMDATGRVLHRSQISTVSWSPPALEITASDLTPAAGSPTTLTVHVTDVPYIDSETYAIRIVEHAGQDVLHECTSVYEEMPCSLKMIRGAGSTGFTARFVFRPTGTVLQESAPVRIDWRSVS